MGNLDKKILGIPRGKVGEVVFKRRNNKIYTGPAPEEYKKTTSVRLIANRGRFAKVTKFSNFVNGNPILKRIWNNTNVHGPDSNLKIFSYNYSSISTNGPSDWTHILPANANLIIENPILNDYSLSFSFQINHSSDMVPEFYVVSLLYFKDPIETSSKKQHLIIMPYEYIDSFPEPISEFNTYKFEDNETSFSMINDYKTIMLFPAIISLNNNTSNPVWAECGGIYIKGTKPDVLPPPTEQQIMKLKKSVSIKYI